LLYLVQNNKNIFYVDIGAFNPIYASNFRNLYDMGYHGINVEASQSRFNDITKGRPKDINVRSAVSNVTGDVVTLYNLLEDPSASTILKDAKDKFYYTKWQKVSYKEPVLTLTLEDICKKYYVTKPTVLNVDVEGVVYSNTQGNNWSVNICRPDIIIVEDNEFSNIAGYDNKIRPFIEDKNYTYIANTYQDNKFFIDNNALDKYSELFSSGMEKFLQDKKVLVYLNLVQDYSKYLNNLNNKAFSIDHTNFVIAPLDSTKGDNVIVDLEKLSEKPLIVLNFDCNNDMIFWSDDIVCEAITYKSDSMTVTVSGSLDLVRTGENKNIPFSSDARAKFDKNTYKESADIVAININTDEHYETIILFDTKDNCGNNKQISNCVESSEYSSFTLQDNADQNVVNEIEEGAYSTEL
jgi:FkbM family methyltransferase